MNKERERELLREGLERIGMRGGGPGGRLGARLSTRWLRCDEAEKEWSIRGELTGARTRIETLLGAVGELVETADREVTAVVRSGAWSMNPAVVTVQFEPSTPTTIRLRIRAVAAEGLVKQHGGRKAVDRVIELLSVPSST